MVAVQIKNSPTGGNSGPSKSIPASDQTTRGKRTKTVTASILRPLLRLVPEKGRAVSIENNLTDMGNAAYMRERHGEDVRYAPKWGSWMIWNGKRWEKDETYQIYALARDTILSLCENVRKVAAERQADLMKHAARSQSERALTAMVELLKSEQGITIRHEEFDADDMLLNVDNGTIDLRTGEIHGHRREDLITKLAPVTFDPKAQAPRWLEFLNTIMSGDGDLVSFLQEAIGVSLSGDISDEIFIVLHGAKGGNGKSTFLETVRMLLGSYAQSAPSSTFIRQRDNGISNDIARLEGARFVSASETEEGQHLADVRIKELTGGDMQTARYLHHEFFEFRPKATLFLATNHRPRIKNGDEGIWRRVRLVPFHHSFTAEGKQPIDKTIILANHRAELSGILNWALAGWAARQARGRICFPKTMQIATAAYRKSNDIFGMFLEDCCVIRPDAKVSAGAIYKAYKQWCMDHTERERDNAAFAEHLIESKGFERRHTESGNFYYGVGMKEEYPFAEPAPEPEAPIIQTMAAPVKARTGAMISPPIPAHAPTAPVRAARLELSEREKELLSYLPEDARLGGSVIAAVMHYVDASEPEFTMVIPSEMKGLTDLKRVRESTPIGGNELFQLLGWFIKSEPGGKISKEMAEQRVAFGYRYLERLRALQ